jgi:hypothetical protein
MTDQTPPASVENTPEFQAALAKASAEMEARIVGRLTEQLAAMKPSGVQGSDQALIQGLALAIQELNDQGTGQASFKVAPEILVKRNQARDRMWERLILARKNKEKPEYTLVNETYLDHILLKPFRMDPATKKPIPVEIIWKGVPNECMRPNNTVARELFALFMESIGGSTELVGKSKFKPDNRAFGMTLGGLVVKGMSAAQRREIGSPPPLSLGNEEEAFDDEPEGDLEDPRVGPANDPRSELVHVLGTVAPPARQGYGNQGFVKGR